MAINIPQGIRITGQDPIDVRILLTKAEMLSIAEDQMPVKYFAICVDDGGLYLFDKDITTPSPETGKFVLYEEKFNLPASINSWMSTPERQALLETALGAAIPGSITKANVSIPADLAAAVQGIFNGDQFVVNTTTNKIDLGTINNAYNSTKQIADYLFEVQYSTDNVDYDYANTYFHNPTTNDIVTGGCTGVVKDGQVLRQLDYYYDNLAEFVVRRPADEDAKIHASIGISAGCKGLTKTLVESGAYSKKYKMVPFLMTDGINDAGVYIQQNVVQLDGIVYDINPTATEEVCIAMVPRLILDKCATFDEIETKLNSVHIYGTTAITYGTHHLVAIGSEWRVIEYTANSWSWVKQGTTTNTMPNGIMTNFRTTGLSFSGNNVDWTSIETYGIGAERYDLATKAFDATSPKTLEELRSELAYSHFYLNDANPSWKTELSGETISGEGSHQLTVMDAKNGLYPEVYAAKFAEALANWNAKTREDGHGVWHTVHSAIYDLANLSFNVKIQERFNEAGYDFSLNATVSATSTMDRNFITGVTAGFLPIGTQINASDKIKDVLYRILYNTNPSSITCSWGGCDNIPTSVTEMSIAGAVDPSQLASGTFVQNIAVGNTSTHKAQYVCFALPHTATVNYQITSWQVSALALELPYTLVYDSTNSYNIYYLNTPSYDVNEGGIKYRITAVNNI